MRYNKITTMGIKRKILNIVIPIIVCFLIGYVASLFQAESIKTWYPMLIKPSITPANYIFPIAWGIIYFLMGVSIGIILNKPKSENRRILVLIFSLQLLLNFTWSIMFFYLQSPLLGLMNILLLYAVVLLYIVKAFRYSFVSSLLFTPYILWLTLATYLNTYIFIFN